MMELLHKKYSLDGSQEMEWEGPCYIKQGKSSSRSK